MNSLLKRVLPLLLGAALVAPSFGQALNQLLQPPGEAAKSGAGGAVDPLGRQTPNGTLFGFLQATQSGNYGAAALYLQMSPARRESQGEDVANELKAVLDRAFVGSLRSISNNPEGTPQLGLPPDREKIGSLSIDDTEVDVILARVNDPNAGKIWLFSSETLSKIHDIYQLVESHRVETHVPQPLVRIQLFGMSVWMWLALLLGVPIAAGVAWLLIQLFELPRILWLRHRKQPATFLDWRTASAPVWLVLGVMIHRILVSYIGMPLLHRHYYYMTARVVLVVGFSWLVLRLLSRGLENLRIRAIARGSAGTGSLVLLGKRVVKVMVVLIAGLTILGVMGFNMTTALAGLGIGGLAIGFGAQKTIENLFGGVSLLGDEVIRVGDSCNFNGRVGTIEDISLRSTRIRTVERTELSIPNGTLATMSIENFSKRDKILFNPKIGLRYETTPDQLRYVLANARRMLYEHPKVETSSARIRLASLDDSWLTLEVFSYVLTRDYAEFTAIREDILLRMIDIINESGAGFAFPSQTLYLGRDSAPEKDKVEQAVESVKKWREEGKLPFPDFAPHEVSEFRDSLPYPSPESAVKDHKL